MARQTVVQIFRDSATDEQWKEVVNDHKCMTDAQFKEKYHFSWSAVRDDAAEKGYYEKMEKISSGMRPTKDIPGHAEFVIRDMPDDEMTIKRTIVLYESTSKRLAALEKSHRQYTKMSIINQLFSEVLEKYGY